MGKKTKLSEFRNSVSISEEAYKAIFKSVKKNTKRSGIVKATAEEIAMVSGYSLMTVRRAYAKMKNQGILTKSGNTFTFYNK